MVAAESVGSGAETTRQATQRALRMGRHLAMGLVLLVLGLAALPAVSATTLAKVEPQPALHQCVETLESIPASAKGSPPVVHLSAAEGAVHSMTLGAVYDRGHIAPRAELSRVLIDSVGDNLDFIVVFTGFEFATGDALAFYSGVRNEVQGIGLPTFDHSAAFGSRGRLQGYVDMAALTRYALNTSEPAFQTPLNTLSHELMHRWGIAARFRTSTGTLSSDLLGRDGSHWSLAVDSSASIMYGARWSPLGGDQYRLTEARQRFSRWDLYLAGWASAAEVPPLYLLRDSPLDPNALPIVGQQVQARLETVRIEQLIEAEGERMSPSVISRPHWCCSTVLARHTIRNGSRSSIVLRLALKATSSQSPKAVPACASIARAAQVHGRVLRQLCLARRSVARLIQWPLRCLGSSPVSRAMAGLRITRTRPFATPPRRSPRFALATQAGLEPPRLSPSWRASRLATKTSAYVGWWRRLRRTGRGPRSRCRAVGRPRASTSP
jgi:hypothetical protein